ncbi:hypothetical protein [Roseomonas fluvialis]|uniref:LemA family protein n=1 Tax=Roseomonas fluvialis TaxID=1750527 RepID=A0ABM7Y840_9PROT|nr:hypothetical protein [Roseomonas fluvialis]BDG74142.1 hypothetical protein Rmf_40710 [Roseomonas fluvialis]
MPLAIWLVAQRAAGLRSRADHDAARGSYEAVLPIVRAAGARIGEAIRGLRLGRVSLADEEFRAVREDIVAALSQFRALSPVWNEADALPALGDLEYAAGNIPAAAARYLESEEAFLRIGNAVNAAKSRALREALAG